METQVFQEFIDSVTTFSTPQDGPGGRHNHMSGLSQSSRTPQQYFAHSTTPDVGVGVTRGESPLSSNGDRESTQDNHDEDDLEENDCEMMSDDSSSGGSVGGRGAKKVRKTKRRRRKTAVHQVRAFRSVFGFGTVKLTGAFFPRCSSDTRRT